MQSNVVKEAVIETGDTIGHRNNEMKQVNVLDPKPQPDIPLIVAENFV